MAGAECGICGGTTAQESEYVVRCDDGTMGAFPSLRCEVCGGLRLDRARLWAMRDEDVPSSLRIRCAASMV
jgi:hypothetical protein